MTAFALRAPWYVRERGGFGLRDPRALRPAIQMYDRTDFVKRLLADPRDSLAYGADDVWSYPVPVTPAFNAHGRARLATSQLITTQLRKLYQPSHNRFYVVVVEVFCDQPGLPRAGSHDDISVSFVMRRQRTSVSGARGPSRRLARNLLVDLAAQQNVAFTGAELPEDARDLWWAKTWRDRFEQQNQELLEQVQAESEDEYWYAAKGQPAEWRRLEDTDLPADEQPFPMWRLPRRPDDCDAAATRSTWFGVIPTYSSEHSVRAGKVQAKLDDRAIYHLRCIVTQKPAKGHEHCPPKVVIGAASEPFRLASPMDPQGTSKRITTITLPDLRRLAAHAGRPQGPGGVRIVTPPQSQLVFNPFKGNPASGSGAIGAGGGICTFAIELFFIVAFFLFLMFLPIVILAFQLWWMLALRLCIPPSIAFGLMADFFAEGKLLADLELDANLDFEFNLQFGTDTRLLQPGDQTPGWPEQLNAAVDNGGNPIFANDPNFVNALVVSTDPSTAVLPSPPPLESKPADPLCKP
ncbi:MAG TPA: hypothetical protein VJ851_13705 [Jatrophihabitans sp.]|nr:hypothetical protein [Jatrophihabitans sp.]